MSAIAIPSFPGHRGHMPTTIDRPVSEKSISTLADAFGQARIHAAMSARANAERRNRLVGSGSGSAPIRLARAV